MPSSALLLTLSIGVVAAGTLALESSSRVQAQANPLLASRPDRRPAPPWKNESWLNADRPLTLKGLEGEVVLLNFWVFTYNCTNTVPSLVDFDRKYRDRGLVSLASTRLSSRLTPASTIRGMSPGS